MPKLICLLLVLLFSTFSIAQKVSPADLENLDFRFIGPEGNRAIAIAGVPGDPMISYIGAASGGLWKTTDGGFTWAGGYDELAILGITDIIINYSIYYIQRVGPT